LRSGRAAGSVEEVPVVLEAGLEVGPLAVLAVLLLGVVVDLAALLWAVVMDELPLAVLPPALLLEGLAAELDAPLELGAAPELPESVLDCAYARPITVTAAAAAIDETIDLLDLMVILLSQ